MTASRDRETAKRLLSSADCVLVFVRGGDIQTSSDRGIAPLLALYDKGKNFSDFCVADKVVGKAAAMLYALMKVGWLYAEVISKSAIEVLEKFGIPFEYGTVTDYIINRSKDGMCPMETAVLRVSDPCNAPAVIRATFDGLKKNAHNKNA